jgi:hypothetical protein
MRVVRAATASLALAALVVMTGGAADGAVTLAVPGRANANVSLAADGAFVVAVWSAAGPKGDTDVFAATSRSAGRTFSTPVRVNSTPGDVRVNAEQPPRVALKRRPNGTPQVGVVWTAKGTQGTRMLTATSNDGGATFSTSALVPGSDAPGNRGWEALGVGPGDRMFTAWLDHRRLAAPQEQRTAGEHHHGGAPAAATGTPEDGVAMAQLSQLYVASLDGSVAPTAVTGGVCYCCKTAIASGAAGELYVAWRHVYAGNMRDIAFTVSRDGGRSYAAPVRVSEDKWQIAGCPDDGPSMVVDGQGVVHVVWPSVVTENGGPVKTLFHAMSRDGRTFSPRERIPTEGQAHHPQLSVSPDGALAVVWDESGSGARRLASAVGRVGTGGRAQFARSVAPRDPGLYPVVVDTGSGWLRAWTTGDPAQSVVQVAPLAAH